MSWSITSGYQNFQDFVYCTSTFTNITMPFIWINFAVLWNVWFSKIFCKMHWSNVFFFFDMPFLKFKTPYVSLLFLFLCFGWPTYFLLSENNFCYICRFYHERAFELPDWLIWLVHQFWLVHLNKHHLVEILLTACDYHQIKDPQSMSKNV